MSRHLDLDIKIQQNCHVLGLADFEHCHYVHTFGYKYLPSLILHSQVRDGEMVAVELVATDNKVHSLYVYKKNCTFVIIQTVRTYRK